MSQCFIGFWDVDYIYLWGICMNSQYLQIHILKKINNWDWIDISIHLHKALIKTEVRLRNGETANIYLKVSVF